mmetsp:Transcript_10659/g.23817  ORF Transcript_10659/g.23817 Transcript_10659/m.23817 type:complete len:204 (-) Transcript_10659:276-887(-)
MAHGRADNTGFGKCRVASTTARADDWMPTSIEVVRETRQGYPKSLGTMKPSTKPSECRRNTASSTTGPAMRAVEAVCPTIDPQIRDTISTEMSGVKVFAFSASPGIKWWISRPIATGPSTTWKVDTTSPTPSMRTRFPASMDTRVGVARGARSVDPVVISTERATSPLAMSVMRFDDVPPGHEPNKISPAAMSAGSLRRREMR